MLYACHLIFTRRKLGCIILSPGDGQTEVRQAAERCARGGRQSLGVSVHRPRTAECPARAAPTPLCQPGKGNS